MVHHKVNASSAANQKQSGRTKGPKKDDPTIGHDGLEVLWSPARTAAYPLLQCIFFDAPVPLHSVTLSARTR